MKKGCVYATTTLLYGNDGLIKIGSTSKEKPIERLETGETKDIRISWMRSGNPEVSVYNLETDELLFQYGETY